MESAVQMLRRASAICLGKPSSDELQRLAELKAASYNRQPGKLTGYDCKLCLNRGTIMRATEDGLMAVRECRCMAIRRSLRMLEQSGLAKLVPQCRFEAFQTPEPWQRKALEAARTYAADPTGRWFLASGTPGSGKTHLCTAICRELMLCGRETRYMLWTSESKVLKACVNDAGEYARRIDTLKTVPVLYIDDFLKCKSGETPTAGDVNLAFEIINARYMDKQLVTVISSEWYPDDLIGIDGALGSRIYERAKESTISIVGEDKNWRLK